MKPPDRGIPDVWSRLRAATPARIGLGRSGDAIGTGPLLDFQLAHAHARDAIHRSVDFATLSAQLSRPFVRVHSAAPDRASYIRRPDLGRDLDPDSRSRLLQARGSSAWDAVIIVADGLSSAAIDDHALEFLKILLPLLTGWRLAPIILAEQARVALSDAIGTALDADLAVMLIGERPGLSVGNSLGLYLTWDPRAPRKDSERNCISNIHAQGLAYRRAADKLVWLMSEARRRRLSGVALKDEAGLSSLPETATNRATELLK